MTKHLKRLMLLATLCAISLGASGCAFYDLVAALSGCADCGPIAPSSATHRGVAASGSSVTVESSTGNKAYDVSFRGRTVVAPPAVQGRDGDASLNDLVARGRFSGELAGRNRNERLFDDGRWIAEGDLHWDAETEAISGNGLVLLRFKDEEAGMLCVRVITTGVRVGEEVARERGRFIAIGGTGRASRIVASGTFNERARDARGKLSGLTGARLSRYERGLSAPCAALADRR